MIETWMFGFAIAFIILHLLGLGYLLFVRRVARSRKPSDRLSTSGANSSLPAATPGGFEADRGSNTSIGHDRIPDTRLHATVEGDRSIRCRSCGVVNDATFQFCRYCIGELDADRSRLTASKSPSGRGLL